MKNLVLGTLVVVVLLSCHSQNSEDAALLQLKQKTIDSMKVAAEKQHIIDSMNQLHARKEDAVAAKGVVHTHTSAVKDASETYPATEAGAKKKKGMSTVAKGAIIGAGAGAITGAMVDGKKGEGAIVGGLIGAAAGAGTGAIIEHEKKKKDSARHRQ